MGPKNRVLRVENERLDPLGVQDEEVDVHPKRAGARKFFMEKYQHLI